MVLACVLGGVTCLTMILSVLFFPRIKIKKFCVDSYWVIVLLGAILMLAVGLVDFNTLISELIKDSAINPLKILVLFICMTVLSVFLDEVGFFRFLACKTLKKAGNSQVKLFVWLYVVVSVLTVFTSNDIIVLTFTPFICYFAKNAKINPVPFLVAEFIAANTMSMMLIIGNPTNIYIATAYGIGFLDYFLVMALPTLASSVVAFVVLFLIFRKQLKCPIEGECVDVKIENKPLMIIGLILLGTCTVLLAVGQYVGLPMWIVALASAMALFVAVLGFSAIKRVKPKELLGCVKRAPWALIPFVLSMFVIILALSSVGFTDSVSSWLGSDLAVFKYGVASFLSANVINNIPMSVLFCPIIAPLSGSMQLQAVYGAIVGSNLGAFLTPIGALAGIMWMSMLKKHDVKFSYLSFVQYCALVAVLALATCLTVLYFIV